LDYSAGYAFFIVWPVFFLSLAIILLGNIFIFRDISKLKASFEDNELIQKTCTIQLVLATIGFFILIFFNMTSFSDFKNFKFNETSLILIKNYNNVSYFKADIKNNEK